MTDSYKENLRTHCLKVLQNKAALLSAELELLREAANTESKSSAGDKHETHQSMMHLEQEKTGKQLLVIQEQIAQLEKLPIYSGIKKICKGSLVQTDKGWFFIAAAIGKTEFDGSSIFVLSEHSPLGKTLLNNEEGNCITFNGNNYCILMVK